MEYLVIPAARGFLVRRSDETESLGWYETREEALARCDSLNKKVRDNANVR